MKSQTLLGAMLVFALLITACGGAETPATVIESPVATIEPTIEMTEEPTEAPATESPAVTDAPTDAATEAPATDTAGTAGVPVTGAATVNVAEVGTFGEALVDGEGRSLYLFTNDTQNSGTSACEGDCLVNWPPLLTDGDPVAGEGVDEAMLGTITLPDGTTQVTYNGWPLYLFGGGGTSGHGAEGEWFLVNPSGRAVEV